MRRRVRRIVSGLARRLPVLLLALTAGACGSRTGLLSTTEQADASTPDAALPSCPALPPLPIPKPASCTPSDQAPILAAIADRDLIAIGGPGVKTLFHFGYPSGTPIQRLLTSRQDYLGAMVVAFPATEKLEVELVLVRLDGTVLVHHQETFATKDFGGEFGVEGNEAGTFAFGASMGDFGGVWLAFPQGTLLGPFSGRSLPYSPRVRPDASARFVVRSVSDSAKADWLDPCAGTTSPVVSLASGPVEGWGAKLFAFSYATGQLSVETADGASPLGFPPLGNQAALWEFSAPQAMFAIPPFPSIPSIEAHVLILNADTLQDHTAQLSYPGLTPVPPGSWLSSVGDSNNPAGFGLDSSGQVTMFLQDPAGVIHLHVTTNGSTWTPIGSPVTYDPVFAPSHSLAFAEASGTYVIRSYQQGVGKTWQVARPSANVIAALPAAGRISHDGHCVSALSSSSTLQVVSAHTGETLELPLPAAVDADKWVSTWIGGDDATPPTF